MDRIVAEDEPEAEVTGIESTFARIAAGSRIVAALWMAILGALTVVQNRGADPPIVVRPWVVIVVVVLGLLWASAASVVAYPIGTLSSQMLMVDLVVAIVAVIAPIGSLADSQIDFYGGLPLIVVAIAAMRGRSAGLLTAGSLVVVVLATIPGMAEAAGQMQLTRLVAQSTLIFAYIGVSVLVAWIATVLRQSDAALMTANEEVAIARGEAARESERADIGRHLHDSVLQTLALIQRDSSDAQKVTIQARRQERELRDWLFSSPGASNPGFEEGLRNAAASVEERYGVSVDVVVVGDGPPSDEVRSIIGAAREAMANAARHSGAPELDVFGEVLGSGLAVYVRDRGVGFEPGAIPVDRQGVRNSIIARMSAIGGTADVRSAQDTGTEWRLAVPTERSD